MIDRLKFWMRWVFRSIFGLLLGFLVGFLIVIKPGGGRGILRNSDTLPFILGVGLLFITIVTQFCARMDRNGEDANPRARPEIAGKFKHLDISKILSIVVGIAGFAIMVLSFLRTFKILPR